MKNLLRLEELATLAASIVLYQQIDWAWYWYALWFFVPDVGMLGYLVNTRVGAISYNVLHHKGIAIAIGVLGYWLHNPYWLFAGIVLLGHSAFDRVAGYGLKYGDDFHHTHLGTIGKIA